MRAALPVPVAVFCCLLCSSVSAQDTTRARTSTPASVVLMPARLVSWNDQAHVASPGAGATVTKDTTRIWWGLGAGATAGAAAALGATQAFCIDDNGCVGKSIGAILMGTLVGGALEAGMQY